ncbi:DUF2076 domain-containing protein [Microvirga flavescens]|uniref:DUF2076 domain-containing protein n=1 Tax=Microvirga flavescens TaxID=2249811 RepID=UPI000DD99B2C|nr:DUF2076 domain-containing protein [Microvirga flavescens]
MNDQEREVIADIFRRLEQVANQPRDPEAERFIADKVRQQPYATYALAQAVYVQEQALGNLTAENEQLRAALDEAQARPQQQGGFLSGLFGGGAQRAPEPAYRQSVPQASPWGRPQAQAEYGSQQGGPWGGAMRPPVGGGFLQSALGTAAGVAGGMMIANALSHAFGGAGQSLQSALDKPGLADLGGAKETQGGETGHAGITDSLYQNASQDEEESYDDDFGGSDDGWA